MAPRPLRNLDEMVAAVKASGARRRIAVACGQDANTLQALARSVEEGFAEAILVGDAGKIRAEACTLGLPEDRFAIVDVPGDREATREALRRVREGEADVLMKGLVGTDTFLKAVLDKNDGLLPPGAVLSYVCALQVPAYPKLLFVSDTAVLPFPSLHEKAAMVHYAVVMARRFGVEKPRVALVSATEKMSPHFPGHTDAAMLCTMATRGELPDCVMDGPLDVFLACDPASPGIKGVPTPIGGEADVLIFPSLEACNAFYKGLMLFAGGELAGLLQGTTKPVVVMSRSESPASKFYCVALACFLA